MAPVGSLTSGLGRCLAVALLLEARGGAALITSPSDELEVAKDVSGYQWVAWVWFLLIMLYFAVTIVYGVVRYNAKRKEKAKAKFVGPLGFFLSFLVKCPCLTLLLGLLWPLGFSVVGLYASDFKIPVDWAVEDYMDGDSDVKFTEDAVLAAVDEQRSSLDDGSRRLSDLRFQPQTLRYWTLDVYYTAKEEGGNVFSAEALTEIKQFEQDMFDFARYGDFCHVDRDSSECSIPNSVVSIFDPSVSRSSDSAVVIGYDGRGRCLASNASTSSISSTVAALKKADVTWWWDAGFSSESAAGWATRSQFRGGAPLLEGSDSAKLSDEDKLRSEEFLHSLSDDFLSKANEGKQHVVISWQEERFLDGYETFNVLLHDMYWSVGSLLFVFLFLLLQLRSLLLTIFAAVGVLTSFTTAFYWYRVVAGFEAMNLINFISLFLIIGIAADDVLVMSQMYDLGHARISEKMRTPQNTMKWAYFRAGSAMLVTTVTTCGSFFALCTSSIKVLRAFGFFMGATVAWNYINVMLIFPPVLLMVDVWSKRACPCCYSKQEDGVASDAEAGTTGASTAAVAPAADSDPVRGGTKPTAAEGVAPTLTRLSRQVSFEKDAKVNFISRCFRDYLGSLIWHGRWPFTCFLLWACLVFGGLAGWRMVSTNADLPLFANETNIGRQHWILDGVFESYDDAVLRQAVSSFPQENDTRETCPGVGADGCSTCSGNGRCYWDLLNRQFACSCDPDWYGQACSKGIEAFQLNASATRLSHVVILTSPDPLARAGQQDLLISNDGAIPATWELNWPARDWLRISARTGELTEYVGSQPPFEAITVSFDLSGRDAPWKEDVTVELTGPDSEPVSIQLQAAVVESLSLSGIALQSGDTREPIRGVGFDFSPSTLTYLINFPYEHSSVRIVPSFDSGFVTSASVQQQGSGRRLQGVSESQTLESGQVSNPVQLRQEERVAVNVQANLFGASTTYTLYLVRNNATVPDAPQLLRVVASTQSLLVTWSPPAYNGGKEVTGYEISAVSNASVVSVIAPCTPAPCSDGFDTTGSGEACCEHVVFGLTDGESYEVSVRAKNDEGAGDAAEPACSPACLWPAVLVGNEIPAISAAPVVRIVTNGEVEVSLAPENISAGGAVPLRFTCASTPEASANTSSVPEGITISDLGIGQEYTFSCTVANAGGEESPASPSSPAITPSLATATATATTTATATASTTTTAITVTTASSTTTVTPVEFVGSLDLELSSDIDPTDQQAYEAATRQAIANLLGVPVSTVQITSVSRRLSGQERRLQTISMVQFTVTGTSSAEDLEDQISGISDQELNAEVNNALSEQGVATTASVNGFGLVQPTPAPTLPGATFTSTTVTRVTDTATLTTTTATTTTVSTSTLTTSTFATTTLSTSTVTSVVTETSQTATSQTTTSRTTSSATTSTDTTVTITNVAPPNAPAVAAAVSGAGEITVSVTARQSNGALIESFSCISSLRGQVQSAMVGPNRGGRAGVVFSGLAEGITYEFSCTATNVEGTSPPSEKVSATAIGLPAPPAIVAVTLTGSAELTIELAASNSTSAPVDTARCRAVEDVLVVGMLSQGESALTLTGLAPGVAYTFQCNATNDAGTSGLGEASSPAVTALLPPAPPALACLAPGTGEVAVTVYASTSSAEHDVVTAVQCYRYVEGSEAAQPFDAVPTGNDWATTLTGLPTGEELQVRCTAYSEHFPPIASNASDSFVSGFQVTAEYRLRSLAGFAGIDHAGLRGFFQEQLTGVAIERIFVSTSTDGGNSFNSCISSEGVGVDQAHSARRLSASPIALVRARVFVDDASRAANSATIDALNAITGALQSWASEETGGNVEAQQTQEADILGPEFSLSTLESLTIEPQGAGHADPVLDPPFNASYRGPYYANVTSIMFLIEPTASNSGALVRVNGDEAGEMYEIKAHSTQQRYTIVVTAEDQISVSAYTLFVSYPPVPCSAACLNGFCDFLFGQCRCNEGFFEGTSMCSAFCPGNVSKCSGRGRCCDDFILSQSIEVQESFGCEVDDYDTCACELSYTGPDCSQRECPPCQNNRTCLEGAQDLDSSWTCDCGDEFTGDLCEFKKCPSDCSGLGFCDTDTGKCRCLTGFGSDDCSFELGEQVPIESAVEVQLVWGIQEYNDTYHPVYDPTFTINPAIQVWMLDTCAAARADEELQVRQEIKCWIEKFAEDMEAPNSTGFPVVASMIGQQLEDWFEHADNQEYMLDLGTAGSGYSGQIRYTRVRMKINVESRANVNELEEHYLRWVRFVDQRNDGAPQGGRLLMVSPAWTRMDVELTMIRSSIVSVILSLSIAFGVVTLFTGNLLLSSYTILTICLSMMTLFFFLIWVIGMDFGPIQIIGLTTFVGLSVDYTLHTCHGYNESADKTPRGKTTDAMMRLGPAIVGGALTTAGATCFLFACWILPFYQLGVMLFLNTLITLFLTFFFLMPLLMIAGPRGKWCNIYALLHCCSALRTALESPDKLEGDDTSEGALADEALEASRTIGLAVPQQPVPRQPGGDDGEPDDEDEEDNNILV